MKNGEFEPKKGELFLHIVILWSDFKSQNGDILTHCQYQHPMILLSRRMVQGQIFPSLGFRFILKIKMLVNWKLWAISLKVVPLEAEIDIEQEYHKFQHLKPIQWITMSKNSLPFYTNFTPIFTISTEHSFPEKRHKQIKLSQVSLE